jgi:hypothetical protein
VNILVPNLNIWGTAEGIIDFFVLKIAIDVVSKILHRKAPSLVDFLKLAAGIGAAIVWASFLPSRRNVIAVVLILTYGDQVWRWTVRQLSRLIAEVRLTRRHTIIALVLVAIILGGMVIPAWRYSDQIIGSLSGRLPTVKDIGISLINTVYDSIEQPSVVLEPIYQAFAASRSKSAALKPPIPK